MSDLFWLSDAQMARLEPCFPKPHGKPRVDDRRVLSGMIFINRNGLRWRDAPAEYGPHSLRGPWPLWGRASPANALQPLETLERQGHLCPGDGRSGRRARRKEGRHDRRHLPEGLSNSDQYDVKRGGVGA